jgi:putative transposase
MVCDETNEDQSKKELRYKERDREERIKYYQLLRELIKRYGVESIIQPFRDLSSTSSLSLPSEMWLGS